MMRGMFAAISGLKNHQVMLDVTANDIANVNTIGYKSARTTFKDSLTQLQRGASGPAAATAAPTPPRSASASALGSIDNLMRAARCRRRATRSTSRSRARASSASRQTATPPAVPPAPPSSTRAPATSRPTRTATCHAGRLLRPRHRTGAGGADQLLQVPPARTNVADRPGRRGLLRPGRRRRARVGGLPLAGHVPERRGPRARVGQPLDATRPTRAPSTTGTPGHGSSASRPPARSRCPTWTSPRRSRT